MKRFFPHAQLLIVCAVITVCSYNSFAQNHLTVPLDSLADVWDEAVAKPFFKLPEVRAKNGLLDIDLYVKKRWFVFEGDSVYLRSYTYRSGNDSSKQVGPWGPTLRMGPNDKLNLRVHNQLEDEPDWEFQGSIALKNKKYLKDGDIEPKLIDALKKAKLYGPSTNGTRYRINSKDVRLTEVEELPDGGGWVIHGVSTCKCTPEKVGTCKKEYYTYPVEAAYNPGEKAVALRLYEETEHDPENHNHPHGYNTTNMHTHGFHVSPFQDDIFRKVPPQLFSNYFYELDNHTPGTFWYHPHVHGSTALQVASGMSGPIIIEDPDLSDFPALEAASSPEHERVLLINQVNYDTKTRELQSFWQAEQKTGPKGTTFNGIAQPEMVIRPGEVQRWRFIQSGHDAAVAMQFPKGIEVWQIAVDGIYFKAPRKIKSLHMAPGNRSDVLIRIPKDMAPGSLKIKSMGMLPMCEYFPNDSMCVKKSDSTVVSGKKVALETLMFLNVEGDSMPMELPNRLPALGDELEDITKAELRNPDSYRETQFNIYIRPELKFVVNKESFEGSVIHETLKLGEAEQWKISSRLSWHPYHIHVNPFQVVEYAGRKLETPMWKDVVMVKVELKLKKDKEGNYILDENGHVIREIKKDYAAIIRSRYTKYWGDFVLHCHILHHEDQGMMQRIRIQRPPVKLAEE